MTSNALNDDQELVHQAALRARMASRTLAIATRSQKDAALAMMADALIEHAELVVQANAKDVSAARDSGMAAAIIDRLTLTVPGITQISNALRNLAELPDPVGATVNRFTRPNGLDIHQIRVPFGVVAMIYEARPNVTVDAAGLCLKSGNAVLLRGSTSALNTNTALVQVLRAALEATDLSPDVIQLAPGTSREAVEYLMKARGFVDVIIPRGGASLIETVVAQSTVPVIETGIGNCHIYIDEDADIDMAVNIVVNAKAQRVSVCNAAETLLVHQRISEKLLPKLMTAFKEHDVTVHGDDDMKRFAFTAHTDFKDVTQDDWSTEYYSLDIAAGVVSSIDEAIDHIRKWSTGHTEAIVSNSAHNIKRFTSELDSAVIMVNASTRFTDGGEFGFGAEIGISTQKLHARGPMGLAELTTTTYIVTGTGQIRE